MRCHNQGFVHKLISAISALCHPYVIIAIKHAIKQLTRLLENDAFYVVSQEVPFCTEIYKIINSRTKI